MTAARGPVSPTHHAARQHVAAGRRVLALEPRGKVPIGSLAPRGLHDARADPEWVDWCWGRCPEANAGLVSGETFDALDVDGDVGAESLRDLVDAHDLLAPGPVVVTARGLHVYVAPTGAGNRAGFRPGLDWRGRGGYVVGAGSVHASGHRYRWGSLPEWDTPPTAPEWLRRLVLPPRPVAPPRTEPRVAGHGYARAALAEEGRRVARATEGRRNHQLNASAFSLGQLVATGLLDEDEVAEVLTFAAQGAGLPPGEVARHVAHGLADGKAKPRQVALRSGVT